MVHLLYIAQYSKITPMLPVLRRMMKKISTIKVSSKDDFNKALVDLQYHVENQEIEFEKLNRKQGSTEIRINE
jgi:hypothetical protein